MGRRYLGTMGCIMFGIFSILLIFHNVVGIRQVLRAPRISDAPRHTSYVLDLNKGIVLQHQGQPFTQGLELMALTDCEGRLDQCTEPQLQIDCFNHVIDDCWHMFESSGLYGKSYVKLVTNIRKGHVGKRWDMPARLFAEGLEVLGDRIYVATWHEQRLVEMRHGNSSFEILNEYVVHEPHEGWGLESNQKDKLWMSSANDILYEFSLPLKPVDNVIKPTRSIKLKCNGKPLKEFNEMAYKADTGTLWGNVWMEDKIIEIDPRTGNCVGSMNLAPLNKYRNNQSDGNAVWNGIAFLDRNWVLLTGKTFKHLFILPFKTNN